MIERAYVNPILLSLWLWLRPRWAIVSLTALLGCVAILRLAGTGYGLPYLYNSDEWYLVAPALRVAQTGDLHPGRLDYGSAYIYLLAGVYRLAASVGLLAPLDQLPAADPFLRPEAYDEPAVFLVGRWVTVAFSLLGSWAIYRLGRRLFDTTTGLLAAALLALSPIALALSRYVITDPPALTMTCLCTWAALDLYDEVTWRRSLLAGLLVGIAASFKYPIGLLGLPLALAHLLARCRPHGLAPSLVSLALVPVGFVLTTPYAVLDWPLFVQFLDHHRGINTWDPSGYVAEPSAVWYVRRFVGQGDGLLLGLGGLGWLGLLRQRPRVALISLAFPVAYFGVLSTTPIRFDRYFLPILPCLALGAAWALMRLTRALARRRPRLVGVPIGLALALPMAVALTQLYYLSQPDTRAVAAVWLHDHFPDRAIVTDRFGPNVDAAPERLSRLTITDHDPHWYAERNLVVATSNIAWLDPNRTRAVQARLDRWDTDPSMTLVEEVRGQMFGYPEYAIRIYAPRTP